MKKKGGKSRIVTILLLLFAGIFGVLVVYSLVKPKLAQADAPGGPGRAPPRSVVAVRAEPVSLGTIENRVSVAGDVLARSQVAIYPTVAGRLTELRVQIGDRVSRGQTIAMVDPSRPGELYSLSPVVSTITGTALSLPVNPGDTVGAQTAILMVGDLSSLVVETFIPERHSTRMRRLLPALITFEAMPGESFPAEVDEVSPVLDPASRTLRIRLRFRPNAQGRIDPRIKAGMFGSVSLVTVSKQDAMIIPRSAAINTYGSWIVFVVRDDNTVERRELRLGLESEELLEVLEGLALEERVVTAGQNFLSENDPVRVTNDS